MDFLAIFILDNYQPMPCISEKVKSFHHRKLCWTSNGLLVLILTVVISSFNSCNFWTPDKKQTKIAISKSPKATIKDTTRKLIIGLLPFGDFDTNLLNNEKEEIESFYNVRCIRLAYQSLPESAYNSHRERYIADSLLDYLETVRTSTVNYIVGLTNKDISTKKGKYSDWGIFGMGYMPGDVCVVSTYRLSDESTNQTVLQDRLTKTVLHELGHNFGLDHCSIVGCLMEADDYGDKIDTEGKWFCKKCQDKLSLVAKGLYRQGTDQKKSAE
ncbi:MAG: hypothetical protein NTX61_11775 [Bacteroidetes bacterium]|nr:hypothetical protein [Bacteroidota bacterium]